MMKGMFNNSSTLTRRNKSMTDFTLRNSFKTAANKMEFSEIFVNNVWTGFLAVQGTGKTTVIGQWDYKSQQRVCLTMPESHYSDIVSNANFMKHFEVAFLSYLFNEAA
jgi:hypothetical protein